MDSQVSHIETVKKSVTALATHATTMRVTYRDTDKMGLVYYANYLVWFEIGRVELLRHLGQRYRDWEKRGVYLPVLSCWIDYKKSPAFDDVVRIETAVHQVTKAAITFEYKIMLDRTGELLASGGTRHAFMTHDGKITRVGHELLPQFFPSR